MEPRHLKRRSSHGLRDVEVPSHDALEGSETTTPVLETGRNDADFEGHKNHRDDVEDESAADTELLSEDSITESKPFSRASDRMKWWKVYSLHFLFMWNMRTYEYASVSVVFLWLNLLAEIYRLSWCLWPSQKLFSRRRSGASPQPSRRWYVPPL